MKKHFILLILFMNVILFINAQDVTGNHKIETGSTENEYIIKTEISGLVGVDIARVIYEVADKHTYKKSTNNTFFSNRKGNEVKFYIMGVPQTGIINVEYNLILNGSGEFVFPNRIEYSKNEEKQVVQLPQINISNELITMVEPSNEGSNEVKEKLLAEQKAKDEAAKQKEETEKAAKEQAEKEQQEKLLAEQKAKDEAAKRKEETEKAAKEQAEKEQQEKLLAEQKAKDEAAKRKEETEKAAKEQAEKEQQEKLLAEQKAKDEAEKTNRTTESSIGKTYTVQILSLANYSESRLSLFCKKHNLSMNDIIKRNINGLTKISVGKVNSQVEASQLQNKLRSDNNINQSFIVVLP